MTKPTFIYLHGFASAFVSSNPKVKSLEKIGKVNYIDYNSMDTYDNIINELTKKTHDIINDSDDIIFIGTSLGGFYAAEMGRIFNKKAVSINPAVKPYLLHKHVGNNIVNYVTGIEGVYTEISANSYCDKTISLDNKNPPLIILDMADDVIDNHATKSLVEGHNKCMIKVFEGGSHRFDHMEESLDIIHQYIKLM